MWVDKKPVDDGYLSVHGSNPVNAGIFFRYYISSI